MTNKPQGEQAQGRTDLGMNMVRWHKLYVSLRR